MSIATKLKPILTNAEVNLQGRKGQSTGKNEKIGTIKINLIKIDENSIGFDIDFSLKNELRQKINLGDSEKTDSTRLHIESEILSFQF